jgi:hypothetical protein
MAPNAIAPPSPQQTSVQQDIKKENKHPPASELESSWSSMLGLWAWKKSSKENAAAEVQKPASAQSTAPGLSSKP